MSKKLLILAAVTLVIGLAFVTGLVNVQSSVDLYVALPLGAVFLGLFLMLRIFKKEVSLYDEEQHAHPAFQEALVEKQSPGSNSREARGKAATARIH